MSAAKQDNHKAMSSSRHWSKFGHFIRHSLHLLDPVGNGQQVCIFGPTSRILLCSAHSATTGLIICVGVWPQINLGFRVCISWGSGLSICRESGLNTEPGAGLCMPSLSGNGLLGHCRAQLLWGIPAHCCAQHSSHSLKQHTPIVFLFSITSAVSFNWKKWWPAFFNLYLDVCFPFDAEQWILSCQFQFMKTKKLILVPIGPVISMSSNPHLSDLGFSQG